ncbi:serine hydrolase domain-containing protein [Sinorhizobium meliloti]|uniref:serine hydrolase domain-containing protein n=1 Tax=Rhizobium meliloti TaxID=382 RepID=UPI003F137A97
MASQRVCALLVLRDGHFVDERYQNSDPQVCQDAEQPRNGPGKRYGIASVTKSITSTLVGQALAERFGAHTRPALEAYLNQPVASFVPGLRTPWRNAYTDVRLDGLLRMKSGVRWNEEGWRGLFSDARAFSDYVRGLRQRVLDFARRYRKAVPAKNAPYRYSALDAAVAALVADSIAKPTRLTELLEKDWAAIGAEADAEWGVDKSGTAIGPCCLRATARDLARFGLLVLHKGRSPKGQIVPSAWFDLATARQGEIVSGGGMKGAACELEYGYFWWLRHGRSDFTAFGRNGQFVHIYPDKGIVVVQLSDWSENTDEEHLRCDALLAHDALARVAELVPR